MKIFPNWVLIGGYDVSIQHPRQGEAWSTFEDRVLKREFQANHSNEVVGIKHGRHPTSVERRICHLELKVRSRGPSTDHGHKVDTEEPSNFLDDDLKKLAREFIPKDEVNIYTSELRITEEKENFIRVSIPGGTVLVVERHEVKNG